MSCGHCVIVVTCTVKSVDPDAQVTVDLAVKKVRIDSPWPPELFARALAKAGYPRS